VRGRRRLDDRDEQGAILLLVLFLLVLLGILAGGLAALTTPSFAHAAAVRNVGDTVAASDSGIEYGIQSLIDKPLADNPTACSALPTNAPNINSRAVAVSCTVLTPPAVPAAPAGISYVLLQSTAQTGGATSHTVVSRAVVEINNQTGSATIRSWTTSQ